MPLYHFQAAIAGPGQTNHDRFTNRGIVKTATLHDATRIFAVAAFIEFVQQNLGYDIFLFETEPDTDKGPK